MTLAALWWGRHRTSLLFMGLAVACGLAIGAASSAVLALKAPVGSRPTFYIELYFTVLLAATWCALLVARVSVGLPLAMAILAFVPSRSGMQLRLTGPIVVGAAEPVAVLGMLAFVLQTKVLRRERWRPLIIRAPLWAWLIVGVIGTLVALNNRVPWVNYVAELKGFYLVILIAVLCVNVLRTARAVTGVLVLTILSALPDVLFQLRSGQAETMTTLANGATVYRTAGGAGLINQHAFYLMVVFFMALGLALAVRRPWLRLFFLACAVWFSIGIVLTYTRGAWIATALGLVVFTIVGGKRVWAAAPAVAVMAILLLPQAVWGRLTFGDSSVQERIGFLDTARAVIHAFPLLGGGWGSNYYLRGPLVVPDLSPGSLPFWHNDFLIVATQVGLCGLAVFMWIWVSMIWQALRAWRRAPRSPLRGYLAGLLAALIAMLTQATTDMFFWSAQTGPLVWLTVGLLCATIALMNGEARLTASSR